jgi:hypothetical protein
MSESLVLTIFGVKILKFVVADPDPGSSIFLTLDAGSGMEKFRSGIRIRNTRIKYAVICQKLICIENTLIGL